MSEQTASEAEIQEILKLLESSTQEVDTYLRRAIERLPQVIEQLREGDAGDAMAEVASLMQALSGLLEYGQAIAGLPAEIEQVDPAMGQRIASDIGELLPMLLPPLEARDPLLLGDVLEYELLPMLTSWEPVIANWLGEVSGVGEDD